VTVLKSFSNSARVIWVLQPGVEAAEDVLLLAAPALAVPALAFFTTPLVVTSQTPLMVITGAVGGTAGCGWAAADCPGPAESDGAAGADVL
jgi:hypothetical protein